MTSSIQSIFHPRAVAVLGASADGRRIGGMVMNHLLGNGFEGTIYPISRSGGEIGGIPCLTSIEQVSEPVDVAFLAIPAAATLEAVRDCAAAGVKAVIVGSSGYAESGPEGRARQDELAQLAKTLGIHVIGPNCNGIYCAHARLGLGFNSGHGLAIPTGDVAIISHSGALFDVFARRLMSFGGGLSFFVSAGNEADLSMLDYLDYAIDDPDTRVIALVMDGISDGVRFRKQALQAKAAGKQIVALKVGLSSRGEEAAVAHSSRMASGGQVYRALLSACGIPLAETPEGLLAAATFLSRHGKGAGGAAVMSTSGAGGAIMADLGERYSVLMPDFGQQAQDVFTKFQQFSKVNNPIDIGVFGSMDNIAEIIDAAIDDPAVGMMIGLFPTFPHATHDHLVRALATAQQRSDKAAVLLFPGGVSDKAADVCRQAGITVFTETVACLEAAHAYLALPAPGIEALSLTGSVPEGNGALDEPTSLALLASHGVDVVPAHVCDSADAAAAAAEACGYPVVLKGVAPGIAHKSDLGLVKLNLFDAAAVRAAYEDAGASTVVIQPMLKGELEVLAGFSRSADVGGMLIAGMGGIHAEAMRDTVMWAVPTNRRSIEEKLGTSTLGRILTSSRWTHPKAFDALVDALLGVQALALAGGERVIGIDVNPLLLGAHGAVAVDGLVVLSDAEGEADLTNSP